MKYSMKWAVCLLCAALLPLSACGTGSGAASSSSSASSQTHAVSVRSPAALDLTGATLITLTGSGGEVEGTGASVANGVVTISSGGVYTVSGSLKEGRIIVNAPKEEVTIALNSVDITCSWGSPLYIYKAGTATIHLMEGTDNVLADGAVYTFDDEYSSAADEEPNACLYSKADLVIEGTGALTVTGSCNNGITSKDTLQIYDGALFVTAVNHGINGKDSNTIDGAQITVSCGGDAIRSSNGTDATLGWVSISNSALDLTAGEDGIQAETSLTISGGSCTVISGGGSTVQPSEEISSKGLKAGTDLTLAGGVYTLNCSDDAVHSNGDVTVTGGSFSVSTGDDGFHADQALAVSGGEIEILTSYEGLEGTTVSITGGNISILSSDDGVNAAGGADGSGFGGFDRGNPFGGGSSDNWLDISGGYLTIQAGGDGLDSNGSLTISGGTVAVSSTGQGDSALDCDGSFTLSGGTLLAVGSRNMAQNPSQASQYTISLGLDSILLADSFVCLSGEQGEFVFQLPIDANSIVFSSPDLVEGGVYTVSYGGDYSGTAEDGLCSGGSYSGGTELTQLTLSDYVTSYGSQGMMGGRPGGGPRGDWGEFPAQGDMPQGDKPQGERPEAPPEGGDFRGERPNRGRGEDALPDAGTQN